MRAQHKATHTQPPLARARLPPGCRVGRAWRADELRIKSFDDLHKLWFVLVREKNLLATQAAEAARQQVQWRGENRVLKVRAPPRGHARHRPSQCRQSMARIKQVLAERQRHYTAALHAWRDTQRGAPPKTERDQYLALAEQLVRKRLRAKRGYRKWRRVVQGRHGAF